MVKVKYKDVSFQLPESWQEVSFRQLLAILKIDSKDIASYVSILSGLKQSELDKMPLDVFTSIAKTLQSWLNAGLDIEIKSGFNPIFVDNKPFHLPEDIGSESIGQYKDCQGKFEALDSEATNLDVIALYPKIVATYLQPTWNGKEYDYREANKLEKLIWECEGLKVLAFGNFFLSNQIGLKSGMAKTEKKAGRTPTHLWQVLGRLWSGLSLHTPSKS